jgi:hypothetical protein
MPTFAPDLFPQHQNRDAKLTLATFRRMTAHCCAGAGQAHDLVGADPVCRQQHNPRSPYMLLRAVPITDKRFQLSPLGGTHPNRNAPAHARSPSTDEHTTSGFLMLDFVH